jgi:hypothetical protein
MEYLPPLHPNIIHRSQAQRNYNYICVKTLELWLFCIAYYRYEKSYDTVTTEPFILITSIHSW